MAKQQQQEDLVYGSLTHVAGDLWERSIKLRFLGKVCKALLLVQLADNSPVEPAQVRAYQDFTRRAEVILGQAEDAICDYYNSEIYDAEDASLPVIKSVKGLPKHVALEGVIFPYARPQPTFGILCKCTWEKEHGLAVKFVSGKVVEVGFQDIVL